MVSGKSCIWAGSPVNQCVSPTTLTFKPLSSVKPAGYAFRACGWGLMATAWLAVNVRYERKAEVLTAYLYRGTLTCRKQVTSAGLRDKDKFHLMTDNFRPKWEWGWGTSGLNESVSNKSKFGRLTDSEVAWILWSMSILMYLGQEIRLYMHCFFLS